jgi:hypothetical protein
VNCFGRENGRSDMDEAQREIWSRCEDSRDEVMVVLVVRGLSCQELNKNRVNKCAGWHVMIERRERDTELRLASVLGSLSVIDHRHRPSDSSSSSTISSNSPKHSTPSTHSIHTTPRITSLISYTLVFVSEHHHGRQDGRRRGRLCSCRQRSNRRAAFTMYY